MSGANQGPETKESVGTYDLQVDGFFAEPGAKGFAFMKQKRAPAGVWVFLLYCPKNEREGPSHFERGENDDLQVMFEPVPCTCRSSDMAKSAAFCLRERKLREQGNEKAGCEAGSERFGGAGGVSRSASRLVRFPGHIRRGGEILRLCSGRALGRLLWWRFYGKTREGVPCCV
jgi:hypothetical protein